MPSLPNRTAQRTGEVRHRLLECFGLALRERFQANVAADMEAEVRAWWRPPAVKWPHARSQQRGQTGSGVAPKLGESSKERQGSPSQHNARSAGLRPFMDVNIKKSEAGNRVQKLQQALNILGDTEGLEVDGLRAALKRAETAAQGVPVDKQVKDCEAFLSRARAHLEELEQKRSAVAASISAAEQRLVVLKMQQDCPAPSTGHQCRGAKIAGFGESITSICDDTGADL